MRQPPDPRGAQRHDAGAGAGDGKTAKRRRPATPRQSAPPKADRPVAARKAPPRPATSRDAKRDRAVGGVRPAGPAADAAAILGSGSPDTADISDRILERKRARRRLVIRRVLIGVAVAALVGGVAAFVVFSPLFRVNMQFVEVQGAGGDLPPETVTAAVAPFEGSSVALLPKGQIAKAVEADPHVQKATISRKWPDGMRVVVEQRIPKMAVDTGEGIDLVGADGVVIQRVGELPEGVFFVSLPPAGDTDEARQARAEAAARAIALHDALGDGLKAQVSSIDETTEMATVHLVNGQAIKMGDAQDIELKLKVLDTLLGNINAKTFDVSDPRRPVTS